MEGKLSQELRYRPFFEELKQYMKNDIQKQYNWQGIGEKLTQKWV